MSYELKIGETYNFNILFIEGTAEAKSISVIFSDSTGNLEFDIDPKEYIQPLDIDGQTIYAGNIEKPVYFEGSSTVVLYGAI